MEEEFLLHDVLDGVDLENTDTSQRGQISVIPPGEYMVQATEGSVVRKDSGDAMIKLTFEIMEGEFANRKLWTNLNIRHSNPIAQRIATEELTELWRDALGGHGNPPSVENLLWKPLKVKVAVEKRKDTGDQQNRIKRYLPAVGSAPAGKAAPAAAQSSSRPAPAASQQTGNRPAWLKKTA